MQRPASQSFVVQYREVPQMSVVDLLYCMRRVNSILPKGAGIPREVQCPPQHLAARQKHKKAQSMLIVARCLSELFLAVCHGHVDLAVPVSSVSPGLVGVGVRISCSQLHYSNSAANPDCREGTTTPRRNKQHRSSEELNKHLHLPLFLTQFGPSPVFLGVDSSSMRFLPL